MNTIQELNRQRHRLLHHLYEVTRANTKAGTELFRLGDELGYNGDQTKSCADYLEGENFVTVKSSGMLIGTKFYGGTVITITHSGVKEVERVLSEPSTPLARTQASDNSVNVYGGMHNSPIQQGSWSSCQDVQFDETKSKTGQHQSCADPDLCDIVIVTALAVEFNAVVAHLVDVNRVPHPQGTLYDVGTFQSPTNVYRVAIVEAGPGNTGAAVAAERATSFFSPAAVLFVGVAGGVKDVAIGDVVVASKVYSYAAGKSGTEFQPRPELFRPTHRLEQFARAEARRNNWTKRITGLVPKQQPRVHVKPIAGGEQVVSDTRSYTFGFIRAQYSDAVAVEMEGFGFFQATSASQKVEALVIRGVSDLIDDKLEADAGGCQEVAAAHASAFAFEVLEHLSLT